MKTLKKAASEREARKSDFIEAVAEFLTSEQGRKSIDLEMAGKGYQRPDAVAWARIRNTLNLGYASKEEAIAAIMRVLF